VTAGSLDTPDEVTLTEVDGIESRLPNFDSTAMAAVPGRRTSEGTAPEDLTRATIYQHPDHDTPTGWHPPTP
jgi:hypothetical protein